ncbi:hypothetical protein A1O1_00367 [Capronia coronata CBS 617.96]|uniref:Glycosyltransferase 2-like domain-containing protein n=1 Tax=Capronia coronata CBS 617.96 TaxID=1182541 RepID=W9YQQ2_9EURO|nr:uncharacterized protein A1O1_00367 [Capronia coronata CBS 617.96]EXJ95247.1 hypothetical protein A1O1_00367 [Capronia coronata CBS 617.96]
MVESTSCATYLGPVLLAVFLLRDLLERWASSRNQARYRPFAFPNPETRKYHISDVSIIIPTVDTDPSFTRCLCGLLNHKPLEIIIVATETERYRVQALVHNATVQKAAAAAGGKTHIRILTVRHANKRDQLVQGISASRGEILALVDDDAFWQNERLLWHLLAPFQEDDIGLVGCPITKVSNIITPWEVAAIRLRGKRHGSMKSAYAADGGINFCVSGVTMLLRGEILRDPEFQHAFTNDFWMGHRQNSGDDSFITRWVLFRHQMKDDDNNNIISQSHPWLQRKPQQINNTDNLNHINVENNVHGNPQHSTRTQWRLGMQLTSEAEVGTSIMPDARFAGQLKRWYRSGLRHRLMCLFFEPGIRAMWRTCPYMTRKMVEGMLTPVLLPLRLYALYATFDVFPGLALFILTWKICSYIHGLFTFSLEYPYTGKYWWAAVLVDHLYLVSDWYCWATLGTEAWMTRRDVDQEERQVEVVSEGMSPNTDMRRDVRENGNVTENVDGVVDMTD